MILLKYIMFFIILISSGYLGKLLSKRYVDRLKELEDFKSALNIFEAKIKFTYDPINEIFEEVANMIDTNVSTVFKKTNRYLHQVPAGVAWEKAIENTKNNLNNDDKQCLKSLSNLLRTN